MTERQNIPQDNMIIVSTGIGCIGNSIADANPNCKNKYNTIIYNYHLSLHTWIIWYDKTVNTVMLLYF